MKEYTVKVKLVKTWTRVVEADSKDEAEIYLAEQVAEIGDIKPDTEGFIIIGSRRTSDADKKNFKTW